MKAKELDLSSAGKENMIPAFPDMPFTCYTNFFGADTYDYINWHWHSEVQYCLVLQGSVLFRVGEQSYPVEKGGGIVIPSGLVHMSRPAASQPSGYFCLDVNLERLMSAAPGVFHEDRRDRGEEHTILLDRQQEGELLEVLDSVWKHHRMPEMDSSLLLYSDLFRLWYLTRKRLVGQGVEAMPQQQNERLIQILSYLQQHYREKIFLEQVAEQVHLSSSECCRFFKRTLGQTIFEYLQQYRIQKSKELLRQTQMTVAEVAYAVGFNSQSYFTQTFRKETGMTPSVYSKIIKTRKIESGR